MERVVANAAPYTPMAGTPKASTPNTKTPSSNASATLWPRITRSGVAVSSWPRNAPIATVFMRLAGKAMARAIKYSSATPLKAEPGSAPASCNAVGVTKSNVIQVKMPNEAASPMTRPVISAGSAAPGSPRRLATTACATKGTTQTHRKL